MLIEEHVGHDKIAKIFTATATALHQNGEDSESSKITILRSTLCKGKYL